MRRQLAKVYFKGVWRVIYDDSKMFNRYRVTLDGGKVIDYEDLASCLYHISQEVMHGKV